MSTGIAHWPVTDVDTTACDMLDDLVAELDGRGRHFVFAELKDPVRAKLVAYGLEPAVPDDRYFPTLTSAVQASRATTGHDWQATTPP